MNSKSCKSIEHRLIVMKTESYTQLDRNQKRKKLTG